MSTGLPLSWRASWLRLQGQLTRGRKAAGLTQQQLADRLCVDRTTIQRWEDGRTDPSSRDLFRWAAALDVSIASDSVECGISAASIATDPIHLSPSHFAAPSSDDGEYAAGGRTFHGNSTRFGFPAPTGADQ